jgi:hypothetical protein
MFIMKVIKRLLKIAIIEEISSRVIYSLVCTQFFKIFICFNSSEQQLYPQNKIICEMHEDYLWDKS